MKRPRIFVLLAFCIILASVACASAQPADEFFKGKTLRFTVVYEPGGTYDLYSRLLIAHLPKHIPGNPAILIQYMPGAGGMVGTVNLYEKAERDGTQLGMLPRDIAVNQMLHPQAARYDAKRFNWIGRIASYTGVMFVMSRTGVKTADDLRSKEVMAGSWGNTTDSFRDADAAERLGGHAIQDRDRLSRRRRRRPCHRAWRSRCAGRVLDGAEDHARRMAQGWQDRRAVSNRPQAPSPICPICR